MRLKRYSFLIIILLIKVGYIYPQAYNEPESVVYDATNDRYLVSNKGDGNIISMPRSNPNNISYLYSGSFCVSLRGITIVENKLWGAGTSSQSAPNQYLMCFNLTSGEILNQILIADGDFINDVSAGINDIIYLSDNNNIYAVNTTTGGYSTLLANAGANGLLYDGVNNRLLYTDDTPITGSQISAIDLNTNNSTPLIQNLPYQYLDGLTVDNFGNYYVSAWSDNRIYRFDPNFNTSVLASSEHPNVTGTPHDGAADICFDLVNNVLAVPNFNANTVDLIPFSQLSAENENSLPAKIRLHQNFPNPFNPNTSISYDISKDSSVRLTIYDLLGSEIVQLVNQTEQPGAKVVQWDGRNQKGELVNGGVYLYKLEIGDYIETKKMVLLK